MNERFTLGKVLATGVRVWGTNLVPFLVITALVLAPIAAWGIWFTGAEHTAHEIRVYRLEASGLRFVLDAMTQAALTYGVVMELQGRRATIGACISTGLVRFFPVLGVAILTTLFWILGLFALNVPGIVLYCVMYVAIPSSVIERPGLFGAIKRSGELTEGHRLEIFALAVIVIGGVFGLNRLLPMHPRTVAEAQQAQSLRLAIEVLYDSLAATLNAVAYFYLRQEKEGTTAAELAKVFE